MPSFVGDIGSPILHRTEVAAVGAVVTQFSGLKNHSKFGTDDRFFRVKKNRHFSSFNAHCLHLVLMSILYTGSLEIDGGGEMRLC